MANTILKVKRTNSAGKFPNTSDPSNTQYIAAGELALNMADGILYTSNGSADGLIAIGAKQASIQTTTITVSGTFQIGDLETSLLLANSSEIFAGNTTTNVIVSTTNISVANTLSNSSINAQKIFVGNSSTNAQFNLEGGSSNLIVNAFSFDVATGVATFRTSTPHNLISPTRGTYVTLSNLTGSAQVFNGRYEVADILTSNSFSLTNVNFGANIDDINSVSRTNGYSTLKTQTNHGFANGASIIVSGVGADYNDTLFSFDGQYTVVNSIAASKTIQFNQHPIKIVTPSYLYKEYNEDHVTLITSTPHNLQSNYLLQTTAYPSVLQSTPLVTLSSANSTSFVSMGQAYEDAGGKPSQSIYLMINEAETSHKLFNSGLKTPVTVTTHNNAYSNVATFSIISAFVDRTKITNGYPSSYVVIVTNSEVYGIGDAIVSGFTGYWAFLNDKELPFTSLSSTVYSSAASAAGVTEAYNPLKCFALNITKIIAANIPLVSNLPTFTGTATGVIRIPNAFGTTQTTQAVEVSSIPYVIRIDTVVKSTGVSDYLTSDRLWGVSGTFRNGLNVDNEKNNVSWTGTWNYNTGVPSGTPFVTLDLSQISGFSVFSVGQWILFNSNGPASVPVAPFFNLAKTVSTGKGSGLYQIYSLDAMAKTITFAITLPQIAKFQQDIWVGIGPSYPTGFTKVYPNTGTMSYVTIQPFTTVPNTTISVQNLRPYLKKTPIQIVNTTAFTMPLVQNESPTTVYGSSSNPLPIYGGQLIRNTDIAVRSPYAPPARVSFGVTGTTVGNCYIEYSSYVEVVNASAAIRVTPSTFYNGNSTANLFSNSSSMSISSTTDAVRLSPNEISVKGLTNGVYDSSKPLFFVNSSILKIGTGRTGTSITAEGKIETYGSQISVGTEVANVLINETSLTISSNNAQTILSPYLAIFSGNVEIGGSLYVGGSYGDVGQVLATDGGSLYWTESGLDFDRPHTFNNDVTVQGMLHPNTVSFVDDTGNHLNISANELYFTTSGLEYTVLDGKTITLLANGVSPDQTVINPSTILLGNSSVNATVNSTAFSGTANNAAYAYGKTESDLNVNNATYAFGKTESELSTNTSLVANNANNLGGVAAASYVNTSGAYTITGVHSHTANVSVNGAIILGATPGNAGQVLTSNGINNVYWSTIGDAGGIGTVTNIATGNGIAGGPITTTGTLYVVANTGIVSNTSGLFVNTAFIATLASNTAASAASANNATYFNGLDSTNYVNTSQLSSNLANYSTTTATTSNAATAYANATAYADNRAGSAYSNATAYADLVASAAYTNAVAAAAASGSNNASYLNGKTESNLNVNNAINANNASYLNTKSEGNLNVNNASTALTANNSSYLNTKTESNLNVNNSLTSNNASNLGGLAPSMYAYANLNNLSNTSINKNLVPNANNIYDLGSNELRWNKLWIASNTIVLGDSSISATGNAIALPTGSQIGGQVIAVVSDISGLTANSANFVGSLPAANVVSNAQLTDNLARYATLSGTTFTGAVIISNNLTVSGNLTLSGNTVSVGANNLVVRDAVFSLHTTENLAPWTSSDGRIIGTAYHYYNGGDKQALLAINQTNTFLTYYNTSTDAIAGDPVGTTLGTIQAGVFFAGDVSAYSTINATSFSGSANNTSFVGSVSAANVVSNTQLSSNLANYQTTAGLSANVATLAANNASYLGGVAAASYALTSSLSNYSTTTATTANAATAYANATAYADNRAGSAYTNAVAAAVGTLTITGVHTHSANLIISTTAGVSANGGFGTAGQVLTSNGTSVYWTAAAVGTNTAAQFAWTNTHSFSAVVTHTANVSVNGAIVANGGAGNAGQVLTSAGVGNVYWANSSSATGAAATAVRQSYTGDGTTTSFTVTGGYSSGQLAVFLNGVMLRNGTEVTVTSGTSVVFASAPPAGSLLDVIGSLTVVPAGISIGKAITLAMIFGG